MSEAIGRRHRIVTSRSRKNPSAPAPEDAVGFLSQLLIPEGVDSVSMGRDRNWGLRRFVRSKTICNTAINNLI